MNITQKEFTYDMTTSRGLTVSLMSLGAGIQSVSLTDHDGIRQQLTLSFDNQKQYENDASYAGATLAPNAGRIRDGKLPIHQQIYSLTQNDFHCQLHGGIHNLSSQNWMVESMFATLDHARICFLAHQPDGLDGYPGNRTYRVSYTLDDTNWLSIQYYATTDQPTYMNLSNHTYWNLSGDFTRSARNQELQIFSNSVCINNKEHLPIDILPVPGTAFDFRSRQSIDAVIQAASDPLSQEQLQIGNGYNNAFLLNKKNTFRKLRSVKHEKQLSNACILRDPDSGRTLKMLTDAPALVLYSGGYLPENLPLTGGAVTIPSCAIALEAQDIPDVMHLLPAYYQLTTPEHPFQRTIRLHIS